MAFIFLYNSVGIRNPVSGVTNYGGDNIIYTEEEILRDLNTFKLDTLQRVLRLEMKVDEMHNDNTDIINDIHDLREIIIKDVEVLNQKIDLVNDNKADTKAVQVIIGIVATVITVMAGIFAFLK